MHGICLLQVPSLQLANTPCFVPIIITAVTRAVEGPHVLMTEANIQSLSLNEVVVVMPVKVSEGGHLTPKAWKLSPFPATCYCTSHLKMLTKGVLKTIGINHFNKKTAEAIIVWHKERLITTTFKRSLVLNLSCV